MRAQAGLSQGELATRAGTSRTRLSAYEHGHTEPGLGALERIAAGAGLELAVVPAGTARVRGRVGAIAEVVRDDATYALRLVAELVDWLRRGIVPIAALDADPGSIGDERWDALIGGIAEMMAHELDHPVPTWASAPSRRLAEWWFIGRYQSTRPFALLTTPPALAARGVFVSAASLGSV